MRCLRILMLLALGTAVAATRPAAADTGAGLGAARVPVSAFARPAFALDPTRLQVSTMLAVGSGFGGSSALSVTSIGYQFAAPLWLQVSVGNSLGGAAGRGGTFLEGVRLAWQPTRTMRFDVQYHDFRSPLQYRGGPSPFFREY